MASMLLLSSTTYAVEMSNSHMPTHMTSMSKAEATQMLKDAGVAPSKVKMLENGEMAKTEGEWWPLLWLGALGGVAWWGGIHLQNSINQGHQHPYPHNR